MKQKKINKTKGFTLVELITVIGILALLSIFVFRQFGNIQEDSKFGLVQTIALKNIPAAISSAYTRLGSCQSITKPILQARGLNPKTPWGDDWSLEATERSVVVTYPIREIEGGEVAAADATALRSVLSGLQVNEDVADIVNVSGTGNSVVLTYKCAYTVI